MKPPAQPDGSAPREAPEATTALARQTRALLELIETERTRQCGELLGAAGRRAATLRAQAHAEARERIRQAFAEERRRLAERVAAAEARLATQRRLHAQRRVAALLQLAWPALPGELCAVWQQPALRTPWVEQVFAAAQALVHLEGSWRVQHAPDWPEKERARLAGAIAAVAGAAPRIEPDAAIAAGLRIAVDGNVVDGTLEGLLADRAALEARLANWLQSAPP